MIGSRWYMRPNGERLALRKTPRPASWNKWADPAQAALREYLDDTENLVAPSMPRSGPWSVWLDIGLPADRVVTAAADLDNYALPVASRLMNPRLASVWCSKRHAAASYVVLESTRETEPPTAELRCIHTTTSVASVAFKQQVRAALADASELPAGGVWLQIAFVVGPMRNWLNLWKPTIDALDPLLGRTYPARDWHPRDGRIVDLGLHLTVEAAMGNAVELTIAAGIAK